MGPPKKLLRYKIVKKKKIYNYLLGGPRKSKISFVILYGLKTIDDSEFYRKRRPMNNIIARFHFTHTM